VPVHEKIDKGEPKPVLAAAAAQIAGSGLIWKWQNYDGTAKLCSWDGVQKIFLRGTLVDWRHFFGGISSSRTPIVRSSRIITGCCRSADLGCAGAP
jgi:hypothetical protein